MHRMILSFVGLFLSFFTIQVIGVEILHEWVQIDYTWDLQHTYEDYIQTGKFIPENCVLAGINVAYDGNIYLTVPRWKPGVPGTLNLLNTDKNTLTPYPTWKIQEPQPNGENYIKNVQSMTIDSNHNMWIVDVGRLYFYGSDPDMTVNGPAQVWVYNMELHKVILNYQFPNSVANYEASFLNDIALDEKRSLAYFSDAWGDGGIIVFDAVNKRSRRYSGVSTGVDPSYVMIINGVNYGNTQFTTPIDGIAITDDGEGLFYCAVQGTTMYRLPTSILRDFTTSTASIDAAVQVIGQKEPSDGMKYYQGRLYWGALTTSTFYNIAITATTMPNLTAQATVAAPQPYSMEWIDTFAIDLARGKYIYFVSNRLDQYFSGTMDFTGAKGANMRILRVLV